MSGSGLLGRRLLLLALAAASGVVGLWALLAPESFYQDFVFGRGWIRLDGPYNEHLLRDVGALNLALAAVLVAAGIRMQRPLVRLAAVATLIFAVPHLGYHAGAMDPFPAGDVVAQLVALVAQVLVPLWLVISPNPRAAAADAAGAAPAP